MSGFTVTGRAPSTLQAVARASQARDTATDAFHQAIRNAHQDGHPMRDIAQAAGVSASRIYQILRDSP